MNEPLGPASYVVAGCMPWSRAAYDRPRADVPGMWTFIGAREELTLGALEALAPRFVFFLHRSWLSPPELHAAAHLGATGVRFAALPDDQFDRVPLLDLVRLVEGRVAELAPALVLGHWIGDLNIDHHLASRAVLTATRPVAGQTVRTVLAFEVPSSTEWAFGQLERPFSPSTFYDVGATLDRKVEAMAVYEGESRSFPHPRSPEALPAIAARWGSVVGASAAEAFELVRDVR